MTGGVQIVGDTWADNADTVKRPSYSVVNMGLQWKPYENTTISVRVYNLFDTVYATSGGTTQWLLGRPRTGEIALNVKF
jgi:iron complex outermembrane receptor protein